MKNGILTLTATGVALALGAALLPTIPASAAEPTGASAPATSSVATGIPAGYWGIKTTVAANDIGLRFTDWQTQSDAGYQPEDVTNGVTRFFVTSDHSTTGVSADSTARIYDHGTPTGYYIRMSVGDRTVARQASDCTVYLGDPNAGGTVPTVSPYSCTATDLGGGYTANTWFLRFDVGRANAEVITDPSQQKAYLQNCTADNCAYIATSMTQYTGDETPYGSPYTNNSTHDSQLTVDKEQTVGNTTSFGMTLSTSVSVASVFTMGVDMSYNRTWEYSTMFSQSEQISLDPGQTGWFTIASPMARVTGDFYVEYNGRLYLLPNTTVDEPVTNIATHVYSYVTTPGKGTVRSQVQ
jgi:hypothetical protein